MNAEIIEQDECVIEQDECEPLPRWASIVFIVIASSIGWSVIGFIGLIVWRIFE